MKTSERKFTKFNPTREVFVLIVSFQTTWCVVMRRGLITAGRATNLYRSTRTICRPFSIAKAYKATWWKFKTKTKTDSWLAWATTRICGLVWVIGKRRENGFGKLQGSLRRRSSPGGTLESQTTKAEVMAVHTVPWFGGTTTSRPGTTGTVLRGSTLFAKEVRKPISLLRMEFQIADQSGRKPTHLLNCIPI